MEILIVGTNGEATNVGNTQYLPIPRIGEYIFLSKEVGKIKVTGIGYVYTDNNVVVMVDGPII